ncbi:MAG: transposase [Candidatus Aminicenantales bacterium]
MARQLRIEYPGALYHVKSRGNQKQPIFLSDDDRRIFLACLGDAHEKFDAIIHAYCLMTNHYHLMVETPRADLSRIMHLINTRYSIYLNAKHGKCGHPFQGRFKAIVVEAELYAQVLARYIHLNPVRAGIIGLPQEYEWSNFREYVRLRREPPWMRTSLVLSLFGVRPERARERYVEFVLSAIGQEFKNPLSGAASSGILGSETFIERIKKEIIPERLRAPDPEFPELRKLTTRPELAGIRAEVDAYLGSRNKHAKRAAIFIAHKNTDYRLREIGEFFDIGPSGISSACRKMRAHVMSNESLAQAIAEIERRLFSKPLQGSKLQTEKVAE